MLNNRIQEAIFLRENLKSLSLAASEDRVADDREGGGVQIDAIGGHLGGDEEECLEPHRLGKEGEEAIESRAGGSEAALEEVLEGFLSGAEVGRRKGRGEGSGATEANCLPITGRRGGGGEAPPLRVHHRREEVVSGVGKVCGGDGSSRRQASSLAALQLYH